MESTQAEITIPIGHGGLIKIVYVILTKIMKLDFINGLWYVHFDGSRESISLGSDKPPSWKVGDKIKITLEKV